jgi:hypothetical protein
MDTAATVMGNCRRFGWLQRRQITSSSTTLPIEIHKLRYGRMRARRSMPYGTGWPERAASSMAWSTSSSGCVRCQSCEIATISSPRASTKDPLPK